MAMVDVDGSCQFSADSQPKSTGRVAGGGLLGGRGAAACDRVRRHRTVAAALLLRGQLSSDRQTDGRTSLVMPTVNTSTSCSFVLFASGTVLLTSRVANPSMMRIAILVMFGLAVLNSSVLDTRIPYTQTHTTEQFRAN